MAVRKVEQSVPQSAVSPPWVPPGLVAPPVPAEEPVEYPSEDGIPMGSSDTHILSMIECYRILAHWFRGLADVFVGIDQLVYYERGNPTVSVVPDVYVSFGVPKWSRPNYKVWEEGKPPDMVWEFGPPSSIKGDAGERKEKFRQVGVQEYWLVDPLGEYHDPRLQGFELVDGKYVRMPWEEHPDGMVAVWSPVLQVEQHFTDERLRFWDRETGVYLELPEEEAKRLRLGAERSLWEAASRAERAAQVRWEAETRAGRTAQVRKEAEARARSAAEAREVAIRKMKAAEAQLAELEASVRGPRNPV